MDDMKMRKMRKLPVKLIRPPRPSGMDEEGGMAPRPPRMPMTPRPEVEEAAMAEVQREKDREAMGRAYDEAPRRSMALGLKKGGSVGSASKRADGCAQRGKTKGRMV